MRPEKIPGHVHDVLARSAGDLSWQCDPDRPPACVPPRRLTPAQQIQWYDQWDSAGPGQVSHRSWARIRRAVAVCVGCPVRFDCLRYALDHRTKTEGVWGGMYFPAHGGPAQHPPRQADAA